jgi:hypothetical protein
MPDPVLKAIDDILSDNSTTAYIGVRPVFTSFRLLWQISGLASIILGIFMTIRGVFRIHYLED